MITDQERMKTDAVFVDTIIRECALMAIQCEQYRLKVDELERRVAEQADEISGLQVNVPAQGAADELAALRKRLSKAKNTVEWLMKGGEPCRLCANKTCKMGDDCKPIWKEGVEL